MAPSATPSALRALGDSRDAVLRILESIEDGCAALDAEWKRWFSVRASPGRRHLHLVKPIDFSQLPALAESQPLSGYFFFEEAFLLEVFLVAVFFVEDFLAGLFLLVEALLADDFRAELLVLPELLLAVFFEALFLVGSFLRLVEATFSSSFSLMELAIPLLAPLRDDFGFFPRLAARAAPAAICCFFDFAGIQALRARLRVRSPEGRVRGKDGALCCTSIRPLKKRRVFSRKRVFSLV